MVFNISKLIVLAFVIESIFAGPRGALANAEGGDRRSELVSSVSVSGAAYLAVMPDTNGDGTSRALGFYSREREGGAWRAVVEGKIIPSQTGPILEEFQIARTSKRFEAIAIIDGALKIFNVNSNPDDQDSIISLGQGAYQLVDLLTGTRVPLPIIKSNNDVQIYSADMALGQNHQLVVVSVRNPNVPLEKSGYTFAFMIRIADSRSTEMRIIHDPVLLDYDYHSAQEMRKLIVTNGQNQPVGVVSRLFANSLAHVNDNDPKFLKEWKEQLAGYVAGTNTFSVPPYYQTQTHSLEIPKPPTKQIFASASSKLVQEINPRGQDKVHLVQGNQSIKFMGRIDVDEKTGAPRSFTNKTGDFLFFFLNGDLFFVPVGLTVEPIKLVNYELLPDKISVATQTVKDSETGESVFFITVSDKFEDDGSTQYFRVLNTSGRLFVESTGHINSEFYSSPEHQQRLIVHDEDEVLFDYKTAPQESELAYIQNYREKARHMDLSGAVGDHVQTKFVYPKAESIIEDGLIYYREYEEDEDDIESSSSGVYVYNYRGKVGEFVEGQLLHHAETKNLIWSDVELKMSDKNSLFLKSIIIDSSRKKGVEGCRQYVLVHSKSGAQHDPSSIPIKLEVPVDDVLFVKIIPGLKDSGTVSVVTAFRDNGEPVLRVDSYKLGIVKGEGKVTVKDLGTYPLIGEDVFTEKSLIERVVYNDLGEPFWHVNPEYDLDDPRLSLRSLVTQDIVEPNGEDKDPSRVYKTWWDAHENPNEMKGRHISEPYKIKVHKNHLSSTNTIKELMEKNSGSVRTDLFPHLIRLLNRLADPNQEPEHQVLIVPNDLKPHIEHLILGRYLDAQGPQELWSRRNKGVELFLFGENTPSSQSHLMQQLRILPEVGAKQRAIMYADASRLISLGRLQDGAGQESSFLIPDTPIDFDEEGTNKKHQTALDQAHIRMTFPHALYLLASEGRKIELDRFKNGDDKKRYSQLILASEKEWNSIVSDVDRTEGVFGLVEHYTIDKLSPPSRDDQTRMFGEVTETRAFKTLEYSFDAEKIAHDNKSLDEEEKKAKVISYLVTQVDTLAREQKMNPLMAFSDVLVNFRNMLLYDDGIRKRRVVDYKTVQLVLAKVFKMPFKLQLLEETDPLKILSRGDILSLIQNIGGYPGDFSLTKQVVDVILGQTRQETSKSMPASIVSFGDTSTGKTQLFLSLVKTLDVLSDGNFKLYDLNVDPLDELNMNAKAFILPCTKLTDSESQGGLIDVNDALKHLEHFLASHNGYRGWVLVDDLHYCSPSVRAKVISRLRSLFDTDDERVHVKSPFIKEAEPVSFPVRNLVHFLNFNPTIDQDKIRKYVGSVSNIGEVDAKKLAVASLKDEGVQIDISYFNRYSLFLNMNTFPASAKGPGLINKITTQLRDFYGDGHFVAIAPTLIEKVVSEFEGVDARNFISGAINGIALHVQDRIRHAKGSLYIVVPSTNCLMNDCEGVSVKGGSSSSDLKSEKPIIDFIGKNSTVLAVDETIEGQLHFLNLMVDSFRDQIIEGAVQAVRSDPIFSGTENLRAYIKSFFEQAALDHIVTNENLPLNSIPMDPGYFNMYSELEVSSFESIVRDISGLEGTYFPDMFAYRNSRGYDNLNGFVNHEARGGVQDSRANVNSDYVERVRATLLRYLEEKLRVDDLELLPDTNVWLTQLQEEKEGEGSDSEVQRLTPLTLGRELASLLRQYMFDINKRDLVEKSSSKFEKMSEYDVFRMFMFVIDKAIAKLPWETSMQFLLNNISTATKSMDLGGMSGVQDYLFARDSLIRPTTGDHLRQVLLNSKDRSDLDDKLVKQINQRFGSECERMLMSPSAIKNKSRGEQ